MKLDESKEVSQNRSMCRISTHRDYNYPNGKRRDCIYTSNYM